MKIIIITKFTEEASQNAIKNFNNVRDALEGLYIILSIINRGENEPFIKMGMENIENLYQSFLELIFNDYGLRKLIKKLKRFEIGFDILLEHSSTFGKTNIPNEKKQKNCEKNNKDF